MIIHSLLDTDLYKFTMMQAVLHQFPAAIVEYHFTCRTPHVDLTPFAEEIIEEINHLCTLKFTDEELAYLREYPFFSSDFIEFLRIFQLHAQFIQVDTSHGFQLVIKGPWLHTILFEVPILAIISEIYARAQMTDKSLTQAIQLLDDKIKLVQHHPDAERFIFSDFGTRRRFSADWQARVIEHCLSGLPNQFRGTSNVLFAKRFAIKAMGTMAHEYLEGCQALGPRLVNSQKFAFERWAQEYRGQLGIALSDVIGLDAFLKDFDMYFCKLFDGARHDSGDPFVWGDRLIAHYQTNKVDPKNKTLVFSDALTFPLALQLFDYFKDRAKPVFGIGTNLTNDVSGEALQIVIKMVRCNDQPVAKISDEPDKAVCLDPSYLSYLKKVFHVRA